MRASPVDPALSLLEQDRARYQVHFWVRPPRPSGMWQRQEWRLEDADSVLDVLRWAEERAAGRPFTGYVEAMTDNEPSLLRILGTDPAER